MLEKGAIYVAFLLVKINRKKGENEEKPLFLKSRGCRPHQSSNFDEQ